MCSISDINLLLKKAFLYQLFLHYLIKTMIVMNPVIGDYGLCRDVSINMTPMFFNMCFKLS